MRFEELKAATEVVGFKSTLSEELRAKLSLFSGDTLLPPSLPLSLYGSLCLSRPAHVGFKKDMNSVRMYAQYVCE